MSPIWESQCQNGTFSFRKAELPLRTVAQTSLRPNGGCSNTKENATGTEALTCVTGFELQHAGQRSCKGPVVALPPGAGVLLCAMPCRPLILMCRTALRVRGGSQPPSCSGACAPRAQADAARKGGHLPESDWEGSCGRWGSYGLERLGNGGACWWKVRREWHHFHTARDPRLLWGQDGATSWTPRLSSLEREPIWVLGWAPGAPQAWPPTGSAHRSQQRGLAPDQEGSAHLGRWPGCGRPSREAGGAPGGLASRPGPPRDRAGGGGTLPFIYKLLEVLGEDTAGQLGRWLWADREVGVRCSRMVLESRGKAPASPASVGTAQHFSGTLRRHRPWPQSFHIHC